MSLGSRGCGIFLRIILGIVNVIFLLLGIALIVAVCVLRWGNVIKLDQLNSLVDSIGYTILNGIVIALIVIGAIIIFLSIIGLIGITCSNRCLLIFHEVIFIILFLVHLAALIVYLVLWPKFAEQLKSQTNQLNSLTTFDISITNSKESCDVMLDLSKRFDCCGYVNVYDFDSYFIKNSCCKIPTPNKPCLMKFIDEINNYSNYLIIIPTAVILFIELVSIIFVPFLVAHISRSKARF